MEESRPSGKNCTRRLTSCRRAKRLCFSKTRTTAWAVVRSMRKAVVKCARRLETAKLPTGARAAPGLLSAQAGNRFIAAGSTLR
jgi:hypothetical protein